MRTPNEPTDEFTLPPQAPKQPEPKTENWRPADTPGFLVNDAGQLKTDLPEPLAIMVFHQEPLRMDFEEFKRQFDRMVREALGL